MDDVIIYDIETKETFQEVGSRDPAKLHISCIGAYFYKTDKFKAYTEEEFPLFWRRLETCDMIVGFNNKGFDDQVCAAYFPEMPKVHSFDILAEVHKYLGFRIKLDNIAHATLGEGKSGDGLKAIRLYREGKIEELLDYCLQDVKVTRDIFNYGKQYGEIKYGDMTGAVKNVIVDFNPEIEKSDGMNLSLF